MVLTPSTMLSLGTAAPAFRLADPAGKSVAIEDFEEAHALLVMFLCNHCPYVKHLRHALADFGRELQERGVAVVAINSNDVAAYPADAPDQMAAEAAEAGYTFPYLFDATQDVAKAYHAACTPDFFLFDRHRRLVYRGQFDDSRPGNDQPITGRDLRAAVDALLAGRELKATQKPSMGCNIKWRPGNQPEYFGG